MNEPFTGGVLERDATRAPRFPRARSRSRIFIFTAKLCLDLVAAMLPARRKLGQKILPAPQLARRIDERAQAPAAPRELAVKARVALRAAQQRGEPARVAAREEPGVI